MPRITPIYIHIPKTGGTSILTALGEKRGLHIPVQDAGFQKRLKKLDAAGREPFLFTVFRDPIERMISLFHYYNSMDLSRPRTQENVLLAHIAQAYSSCDAFWSGVDLPSLANATVMFRDQRWFFRRAKRSVEVIPFTERLGQAIKERVGVEIPHLNRTRHGTAKEELAEETAAKLRGWLATDVEYWEDLCSQGSQAVHP